MGAPLREWLLWTLLTVAFVALVAAIALSPVTWPWRAGILCVIGAILFDQAFRRLPTFDPLLRVRSRLPRASADRTCALTFDDGPCAATADVLDILAAERVPATFFVLGGSIARHPALVQRAFAEGHDIALHGEDHRKLGGADLATVEHQVAGLTRRLVDLGVTPAPLYRTPHGHKSASVFAVARAHGLTLWGWTRGVWDTERPDAAVLVRRCTRAARSGMVLLLHDGRGDEPTPDIGSVVAALPAIVRELKRRGFTFIRLSDATGR